MPLSSQDKKRKKITNCSTSMKDIADYSRGRIKNTLWVQSCSWPLSALFSQLSSATDKLSLPTRPNHSTGSTLSEEFSSATSKLPTASSFLFWELNSPTPCSNSAVSTKLEGISLTNFWSSGLFWFSPA